MRPELPDRFDQRPRRGMQRLEGEAPVRQRRQRIAFGQARVGEAKKLLLHPEDLASPGHLSAPDLRQVGPDIGPVHRLVQDVTALTAGQRTDLHGSTLPRITGHRRGAFARLIVGMGVHGHQPERGPRPPGTGSPGARPPFTGGVRVTATK